MKYDNASPRIDLIWSTDQNGIGHTLVLNYMRSSYKATYGWQCVICSRYIKAHSYKHRCKKRNMKSCLQCRRIEMDDKNKYKHYKSTWDQYCDSKIGVPNELYCQTCNNHFKTVDCYKFHKQVKKYCKPLKYILMIYICLIDINLLQATCKRQINCPKCNQTLYFSGSRNNKDSALAAHKCTSKERFCKFCYSHHNFDEECVLQTPKLSQTFPKLCFVATAVTDPQTIDCFVCEKSTNDKCIVHKKYQEKSYQPYCNFLLSLREVKKGSQHFLTKMLTLFCIHRLTHTDISLVNILTMMVKKNQARSLSNSMSQMVI